MEVQRAWRLESVALKNSMKRHTSPALKGSNPALLEEHEEQNQSTDFTPWNTQVYTIVQPYIWRITLHMRKNGRGPYRLIEMMSGP